MHTYDLDLLGDLIRSSLKADRTLLTVEPLRKVLPPRTLAPTRVRIGPDWYALGLGPVHQRPGRPPLARPGNGVG
ncbi:hypothetical protein ACQPZX_06405 [Actinoplanes sp. CA-142083]|uniref:exo-rhamnogalacturonan lyase family protein n=1 Tax=Actinoplanes sp. CA-142083 TaxID=3239903 RepID=UPI003D8B76F7